MRNRTTRGGVFALALAIASGAACTAVADVQFPEASQTNASEAATAEFEAFYESIERALQTKDLDAIMNFYADDYLHHGITKKQLRFMCLEVFRDFTDLYSVHLFTKITVDRNDAILECTGGLFGIEPGHTDYTTVDQRVTLDHWLTGQDGEWKMVGGATHQSVRRRGAALELHPFF